MGANTLRATEELLRLIVEGARDYAFITIDTERRVQRRRGRISLWN